MKTEKSEKTCCIPIQKWLWKGDKNHLSMAARLNSRYLLLIRLAGLLFISGFMIGDIIANNGCYWIWVASTLTGWGIVLAWLYFLLATFEGVRTNAWDLKLPQDHKSNEILGQISHILFEIVFIFQLPIFVLFYALVVPLLFFVDDNGEDLISVWMYVFNIAIHGPIFLILWIDNFCNTIRIYRHHIWVIFAFIVGYAITNLLFTMCDGVVYPLITWDNIWTYLAMILLCIFFYIQFRIALWYYKRKRPLFQKTSPDEYKSPNIQVSQVEGHTRE